MQLPFLQQPPPTWTRCDKATFWWNAAYYDMYCDKDVTSLIQKSLQLNLTGNLDITYYMQCEQIAIYVHASVLRLATALPKQLEPWCIACQWLAISHKWTNALIQGGTTDKCFQCVSTCTTADGHVNVTLWLIANQWQAIHQGCSSLGKAVASRNKHAITKITEKYRC